MQPPADTRRYYVSIPARYIESAVVHAIDEEEALEKFKQLVTEGDSVVEFEGWLGSANILELNQNH